MVPIEIKVVKAKDFSHNHRLGFHNGTWVQTYHIFHLSTKWFANQTGKAIQRSTEFDELATGMIL